MTMRRNERYLLDTQACVAWAGGKLPRKVERMIRRGAEIYYTEISAWELMIKRVYLQRGLTYEDFWEFVEEIGAHSLPLTKADLDQYRAMPFFEEHPDPFDRMIVAQALRTGYTLVGGDEKFSLYKGLKVLWE
ncbi:MAG: type II toxin-antitoxin system VapC family toxin [Acidobacteriaceae bacterium]|nr:type II toxin-antitoxin system VapC family toxin [Acidobacteriaceae bacterium]